MTSYQVVCSVMRPPDPTSRCQVKEFQEKVPQHLDSVFQDLTLTQSQGGGSGGQQQSHKEEPGTEGHGGDPVQLAQDNLMLCAVLSKTSASFSGADSLQSRVRLPFFWCNLCPFDSESRASLLQHVMSQHCFVCRFCPYVALSRVQVITHGLNHHPQFSQFREQRLRACHLKRDQFQLHFDPQSDCQQSRKRALQSDNESDEVPPAPKSLRRDGCDCLPQAEKVERLQDEEEEEESSGESVDDLPLHFPGVRSPERSAPSNPPACQQEVRTSTHVMENVVSSSGMEPDVGTHQMLVSKSRQSEKSLSPAPATSSVARDKGAGKSLTPSIKQEKQSDDAEFAHALGTPLAEGSASQAGGTLAGNDHSRAVCSSVEATVDVKQEPTEESPPVSGDGNPLCRQESQQGHVLSRSVISPPLSKIRVENLQRQFEESFGVHPVSVKPAAAAVSDCERSEPHPVSLIAQPSSGASQLKLVENFLIDPCQSEPPFPEHSDDPSSPSMLRQLLTRPLGQQSSHQSPVHSLQVEQEGRLSDETERPDGPMEDKDTNSASAAHIQDNFLLTSDKQQNSEKEPRATTEINQAHKVWIENPAVDIKQEPEDSAGDYSTTLHLMASVSAGPSLTNSEAASPVPNVQDVHDWQPLQDVQSLLCKRRPSSHHSTMQSSSSGHQESSTASRRSPHSSKRTPGDNLSPSTVPGSERLKWYSNMSLRDLLTLDPSMGPCAAVKGQAAAEDDDPLPAREGPASRTESGDVVWECGFCHFEDVHKAVVLAHRRLHHAHLMKGAGVVGTHCRRRDGPDTSLAASSLDEEEKLSQEEAEEEDDQVSWMDQPSTSTGYCSISRMFSPTFPPPSTSSGALMHRRMQRARGIRRDDDFEYLSDSTEEFESDPEPDNLDDETYEPPKSLGLANTELSSEEGEDDCTKKSKSRKGAGEKLQRRRFGKKSEKDPDAGVVDGDLVAEEDSEEGGKQKALYRCAACKRLPLTLPEMKDHVRYAPGNRHLLIVRPVLQPASLQFFCPGVQCADVKSTVFTEYQSYLVHVLQCQGYIFDVLRSAMQNAALTCSGRTKDWGVGFLNCPVSHCRFVSLQPGQLRDHLDDHLGHLHLGQMLLFHTVCTVMAKMYSGVDGFDRYICYRCNSILIDLPRVIQHMRSDHKGRVRGVLMVTQKTERRSKGIVVAIQCLKCSMRVPSLHLWFTHECLPSSLPVGQDTASGSDCSDVYDPQPGLPPFQEWVWGPQSSSLKALASTPSPAATTTAQRETGTSSSSTSSQDQLPLICSILLSDPKSQRPRETGRRSEPQPRAQRDWEEEEEEEEVTAMVQCEVCQEFVPEQSRHQHSCVQDGAQKVSAVKKEKESDALQGASASATPPAALQGLCSRQLSSPPVDTSISHSKLLAALAHHHNNPAAPAQPGKHFPPSGSTLRLQALSTTPRSQVISTMPRSQAISTTPRSQAISTTPRSQAVSTTPRSQAVSTTPRSQSASSTHPSLISLLTKSEKNTLKHFTAPQPSHATNLHSNRLANPLMDNLAKFQLAHPGNPATSTPVNEKLQESTDSLSDHKKTHSVLSRVLRQKLTEGRQQGSFSSQSLLRVQDDGSRLKTSDGRSDRSPSVTAALCSQPVEEGLEKEQQMESRSSVVLRRVVSSPGVPSAQLNAHKDGDSPQSCTKSAQPPLLMNFLRQQGDKVRQVLGNILDDQEELSQS